MKFDEVHALVPYEHEGDPHSNMLQVYPAVRVKYPGRHAMDTDPIGGDFVVEVNCASAQWDWRQFTHGDIFKDIEAKTLFDPGFMRVGLRSIAEVVKENRDVPDVDLIQEIPLPGLRWIRLLQASQALAVAEHRRYHRYEKGGGGRFLPLRFASGIVHGLWTAEDAVRVQRRGVHGLRELQKTYGNPPTVAAILKGEQ